MRTADVVVDIGPGAGAEGGEILTSGTLADVIANPSSETGAYLSGPQVHSDSAPPPRAARLARSPQREREQPARNRRALSARRLRRGNRRQRQREVDARQRGLGAGAQSASCIASRRAARTAPSRAPRSSTSSS